METWASHYLLYFSTTNSKTISKKEINHSLVSIVTENNKNTRALDRLRCERRVEDVAQNTPNKQLNQIKGTQDQNKW